MNRIDSDKNLSYHIRVLRARDSRYRLQTLPGPIWVRCPRCDRPARVESPPRHGPTCSARLHCGHCGFAHNDSMAFLNGRTRRFLIVRLTPRCDRCGRPVAHDAGGRTRRHGADLSVRVRCPACRHVSRFPAHAADIPYREGHDPWFNLPLALAEPVGVHLIWAYNAAHVDVLAEWLGATLRERVARPGSMTMMARLPRWMKAASARPRVVAALAKMRERAEREGLS